MFVILSAEREYSDAVANVLATNSLRHQLSATPYAFREVVGCWRDRTETAFQVYCPRSHEKPEFIAELKQLAFEYDQEAVLIVHESETSHPSAFFHYNDGRVSEELYWKGVSEREARELEGWTYYSGRFYTVE